MSICSGKIGTLGSLSAASTIALMRPFASELRACFASAARAASSPVSAASRNIFAIVALARLKISPLLSVAHRVPSQTSHFFHGWQYRMSDP